MSGRGLDNALPLWVTTPPPQRPSLGSGLYCPGPSSLNRPHPPHSQAHHNFTARRLIRDAFAVRERRGDPRVVPSFRCTFLPDMPPLRPRRVRHRYFPELRCRHWPSPNDHRLGTPNTPAIRSTRAVVGFTGSLPLQPAGPLPPCTDQTRDTSPATGIFTSRLSTDRSSSPLLDITTTATELLCWRDSHPLEWQLASLHGHFRPRWSRPRLVHVRFASDSDRRP